LSEKKDQKMKLDTGTLRDRGQREIAAEKDGGKETDRVIRVTLTYKRPFRLLEAEKDRRERDRVIMLAFRRLIAAARDVMLRKLGCHDRLKSLSLCPCLSVCPT
jgi:hypothetical protein